jgi:hypothetical protein
METAFFFETLVSTDESTGRQNQNKAIFILNAEKISYFTWLSRD